MNRLLVLTCVGGLTLAFVLGGCKDRKRKTETREDRATVSEDTAGEDAVPPVILTPEQIEAMAALEAEEQFHASLSEEDLFREDFWKEEATPAAIQYLVRAGVDINARDEEGRTSLMRAARSGKDPAVIRELIAHVSNIFDEAHDGTTVLAFIGQNEDLKGSDVHRDLDSWWQNELHYQMALEMEAARKAAEEAAEEVAEEAVEESGEGIGEESGEEGDGEYGIVEPAPVETQELEADADDVEGLEGTDPPPVE